MSPNTTSLSPINTLLSEERGSTKELDVVLRDDEEPDSGDVKKQKGNAFPHSVLFVRVEAASCIRPPAL
jgi:hypothetical protein